MKNYSILLIDDEEVLLKTMVADLTDEGYEVSSAPNGQDGIDLVLKKSEKYPFDLVITDLTMEGITGLDVLKEVKKISPDTMVMILTGYGNLSSAIEAIKLDADDYILKPCKPDDLNFWVDRCIKKLETQKRLKFYEDILHACCVCQKMRDDTGAEPGAGKWMRMEEYIHKKTKVGISHTYCPECYEEAFDKVSGFKG